MILKPISFSLAEQVRVQTWYFTPCRYPDGKLEGFKALLILDKAAILCHQARLHGVTIHGQLLRIPVLCQSDRQYRELGLESMDIFLHSPILCRQSMVQFLDWYNPPDASDISVSPLLATDSEFLFLPPAYIQVCGQDPLRDEGLAYADRLEECG